MSDRALPTDPGFWWYRHHSSHNLPDAIITVREPRAEDEDNGCDIIDDELVAELDGEILGVSNVNGEWLEPVAPLGTAARLAAAEEKSEHDDYHIKKLQGVLESSTRRHRQKRERIKELESRLGAADAELSKLKERIAAAPVVWVGQDKHGFYCVYNNERSAEIAAEDYSIPATKFRLLEVRDGE